MPRIGSSYAKIGTVAKVEDVGRLRSGLEALVIRGVVRAVVGTGVAGTGETTWVQFEPCPDPDIPSERSLALAREYRRGRGEHRRGARRPRGRRLRLPRGLSDPGQVADTAGYSPDLSIERKVEVLETLDVEQRLEKVLDWAKEVLAELELKDKIRSDVRDGLEKNQREYILRQQMDAIRKELGDESGEGIVEEYRKKIADANMPGRAQGGRARARSPRRCRSSRPSTAGSAPTSTG